LDPERKTSSNETVFSVRSMRSFKQWILPLFKIKIKEFYNIQNKIKRATIKTKLIELKDV